MSCLSRYNANLATTLDQKYSYEINVFRPGLDLSSKLADLLNRCSAEYSDQAKGSNNLPRLNSLLKKLIATSFQKIKSLEQ